jgi:peptidoglycan hydrolase CwlO-like protein
MRKPVLYALVAALVILAGLVVALFIGYQRKSDDFANMKAAEETSRAGYAEAFNAITEIQDSLNAISAGDTTVRMLSAGAQSELKITEAMRRDALERVSLLDASLQRSKERIRRLEAGLKRSGLQVASLERMISDLKEQTLQKETYIAQLAGQVDSLQTTVTGLQTEVAQSQETIKARDESLEQRRRELATVYYVVGTKSELLQMGVIASKGGLLGIGKTLAVTGSYDETMFRPLDTDRETAVPTTAAKVQVLTGQPISSYELKLTGDHMDLHILDPREFRKVRHLVVMTK